MVHLGCRVVHSLLNPFERRSRADGMRKERPALESFSDPRQDACCLLCCCSAVCLSRHCRAINQPCSFSWGGASHGSLEWIRMDIDNDVAALCAGTCKVHTMPLFTSLEDVGPDDFYRRFTYDVRAPPAPPCPARRHRGKESSVFRDSLDKRGRGSLSLSPK